MDTLLADDGTPLATISAFHAAADRSWRFKVLSGSGRVLDFYFHQGGRRVLVVAGESVLRGRLKTRWAEGRRVWQIESVTGSGGSAAVDGVVAAGGAEPARENPRIGPADPLVKGPTTLTPAAGAEETRIETYARSAKP